MEIRMYECGFGDCFRLREANQVDLYVDFGIHSSSWSGNDKTNRFDNIIADMNEKKDFLLTHCHDDHLMGLFIWLLPLHIDLTMSIFLMCGTCPEVFM